MNVCLPMCLRTMYMQYLRSPEEGVGSLELELQTVVSCHVGAGPLQEQPVLSITELCFSLLQSVFDCLIHRSNLHRLRKENIICQK